MFGKGVELKGFNVCKRSGFEQAGDGIKGGAGAGVDEDPVGTEGTGSAGEEINLNGLFPDKMTEALDDLCAALLEVGEVQLVEAIDHLPAAGVDASHIDVPVAMNHAELGASLKEGGYLGAMDNVLAR